MAELNHRVRNMLATIGAIVRLTLTDERPLEEARDALRDRLDALASTYDLLTASNWRGARLSRIAANELRPYGTRARIDGERRHADAEGRADPRHDPARARDQRRQVRRVLDP